MNEIEIFKYNKDTNSVSKYDLYEEKKTMSVDDAQFIKDMNKL